MKKIVEKMEGHRKEMSEWFEQMHRNPELSMEVENTAKLIADKVREWGYEAETGVGKHGVIASLAAGNGNRAIGLRADFDALPIQKDNDLEYKSTVSGVSHLCGHDGHTTMLLAAGKHLAETKNYMGTVRSYVQMG